MTKTVSLMIRCYLIRDLSYLRNKEDKELEMRRVLNNSILIKIKYHPVFKILNTGWN
jgi:hypothetical protein